jgi:phosphoglycolate phosphatase
MNRKLILFDIDGTLTVGQSKIHLESFDYAFEKIWKKNASIYEIQYAGKTEKRVIREVLEKHNVKREDIKKNLSKAYKTMGEYFKQNFNSSKIKINPGTKDLLLELKEHGHILGIVSGNSRMIARLKLEKLDILKFFDVFGLGDTSENRSDLVKGAVEQADNKFREKFSNNDIFVIGDTPFDIIAGRKNRVKTIGIISDKYKPEELKKFNPDYIFPNFKNYEAVVKAIES